jgi:DNA-binding NarL/FixJ family response regulator
MIVVGDPDERTRELAAVALRRSGFEIVEADTGLETWDAARGEDVELVVLEIAFPDMSGYEICSELRTQYGDGLPIIFVSGTRTEPIDRVAGLLLGADDFIVKPFDTDELAARVRRFVKRTVVATENGDNGSGAPRLTRREHEVLELLAGGYRQKEVGVQLSISQKTVGTHIQNLIRKFGVHSRAELVAHAYLIGVVTPRAVEPS